MQLQVSIRIKRNPKTPSDLARRCRQVTETVSPSPTPLPRRHLAERLGHEIHERPYPRRDEPTLRHHRVDRGVGQFVIGEHLHQAPGAQVFVDVPGREMGDAQNARSAFQKYLQMEPDAQDRSEIERNL